MDPEGAIVALRTQAEEMSGPEAMPRIDGDVVLSEPWQGRAVALALETVRSLELSWDDWQNLSRVCLGDSSPDVIDKRGHVGGSGQEGPCRLVDLLEAILERGKVDSADLSVQ